MNKLIKSQEELTQYIKDIESGVIFGVKYLYYGEYTADEFPCVLTLYLNDRDYSMNYYGAAYGTLCYKSDFEE